VCGATIALAALRLGYVLAGPSAAAVGGIPLRPNDGVVLGVFQSVDMAVLGVIGGLVASRQPRNAIAWILCAIPLFLGVLFVADDVYASWAAAGPDGRALAELAAWVGSWSWIPVMIPVLTLFPLLFPTGRPLTPRWRPVGWIAMATFPAILLGTAFTPGPLEEYTAVENPVGAAGNLGDAVVVITDVAFGTMLAASLASAVSLVLRFRRSRGAERQQLKLVTAAFVLFVLVTFAVPVEDLVSEAVAFAVLLLGLTVVVIAVAVAVLRYRLYDIDVVINRALVYGALTLTLGAAYLGLVVLAGLAVGESGLAVAASTLAVAALFRPARTRIQEAVDRRFYRRRYDAARTLEQFGARLRDQVDVDAVGTDLRAVVTETIQPSHATLWLRKGP
jgi:hypothetical protein